MSERAFTGRRLLRGPRRSDPAPAEEGPPASHGLAPSGADHHAEEMPRIRLSRRQVLAFALFVATMVAFLYFVLPKVLGLQETWHRIQQGNAWWFGAAFLLEVASFLGYVALFRVVFIRDTGDRIGWRASYEITMAGLAASRVFAAAGAGGVALTAWALRRSGMAPRVVACRMIAFLVILYSVFMATLVIDGVGLYVGAFPGHAPFAITIVPAIIGALAIIVFLAVSLLPGDFERLVSRWTGGSGRIGTIARRLAAAPASVASGVRTALSLVATRNPLLLGAVAWWGFDILVLWACFHAFGSVPPKAVIVMAYFTGMIGNVLPLPGGIGGVDGGMIGAFSAFGIPVQEAVVAVLAYRFFAFWLPTLPGAIAYLTLRQTVNRWRAEDPQAGAVAAG